MQEILRCHRRRRRNFPQPLRRHRRVVARSHSFVHFRAREETLHSSPPSIFARGGGGGFTERSRPRLESSPLCLSAGNGDGAALKKHRKVSPTDRQTDRLGGLCCQCACAGLLVWYASYHDVQRSCRLPLFDDDAPLQSVGGSECSFKLNMVQFPK